MERMSKLATASTTIKSPANVQLTTISMRTTVGVSFTLLMNNGESRRRNRLQTPSMPSIRMPRSRRSASGETKMESVVVMSRSLQLRLSCNIPRMFLSSYFCLEFIIIILSNLCCSNLFVCEVESQKGLETLNADFGITSMNEQERPAKFVYV